MKTNEIHIPVEKNIELKGNLSIPEGSRSLVIFSHGSGSSRFSSRNNFVAEVLNQSKTATLLTDLLTESEDDVYENRFDIDLLTERLVKVTLFARGYKELKKLPIGYFGASTGAASALQAAVQLGDIIHAVVSRGGRPDLAKNLDKVKAPVLLIVGSFDEEVIMINQQAYSMMQCEKKMEIIEGASHLFEEPGKLAKVAAMAKDWFGKYLLKPLPYAVQG